MAAIGALVLGVRAPARRRVNAREIVVPALLIGVNVGPNLTYVASLATMLWLRVCRRGGEPPELAVFTRHALDGASGDPRGRDVAMGRGPGRRRVNWVRT